MATLIFLVTSSSSHRGQTNSPSPLTSHVYPDEINTDGHKDVYVFVYVVAPVLNVSMFVTPDCTLYFKRHPSHSIKKQQAGCILIRIKATD